MTTRERVLKLVSDHSGASVEHLKDETRFIEDLGMNSLDITEMIFDIEEEFGDKQIPDDEAAKLLSVGLVIGYLEKQG